MSSHLQYRNYHKKGIAEFGMNIVAGINLLGSFGYVKHYLVSSYFRHYSDFCSIVFPYLIFI